MRKHDLQAKVVPGPSLNKSRHPSEATPCQEIKATGLDSKYAQIRTYTARHIVYEGISEPLTWICAPCHLWRLWYENQNPSGWYHTSPQLHALWWLHPPSCQPGREQEKMAWDFESNGFKPSKAWNKNQSRGLQLLSDGWCLKAQSRKIQNP